MAREVVSEADILHARESQGPTGVAGGIAAAPAKPKAPRPDTFQDRLLKYIPAEVVAMYLFLDGVLRVAPPNVPGPTLRWVVFGLLLVGTWFYLARVQKVSKRKQLAISTVAFAIWVFSLGGPFTALSWYSPIYGAILLPLYTFVVPIIQA